MKIYCSCCDKVQPVKIDNCRDAKTNKPFQDIVCAECYLVIASGTGIKREWVGLTEVEVAQLARHELWIKNFIRQIETKLRQENT